MNNKAKSKIIGFAVQDVKQNMMSNIINKEENSDISKGLKK
jgi:hypothetical protein